MNKTENPKLMSDCTDDYQKIQLWRDILLEETITPLRIKQMIFEDEKGHWVRREDILSGDYFTIPDFQRDYNYTQSQKTALIESILLGIPIGSIKVFPYQHEDMGTSLAVIDGQHRLKTIFDFINNKFKLSTQHLTFLKSLGGLYYKDFTPEFLRVFNDYRIRMERARIVNQEQWETIEEFSNQCFLRMNKNPNIMSEYNIAKAEHPSRTVTWLDKQLNTLFEEDEELQLIHSISNRTHKDSHKHEMVAILSVLFGGVTKNTDDTNKLVIKHLQYITSLDESGDQERIDNYKQQATTELYGYVRFVKSLKRLRRINYPYSLDLFGARANKRSSNVTRGIMIRLALLYQIASINRINLTEEVNLNYFYTSMVHTFRKLYHENSSLKFPVLDEFRKFFEYNFEQLFNSK